MSQIDEFLLADAELHRQLVTATTVLASLIAHAPHALTVAHLENLTGYSKSELARLCTQLWQSSLIKPDPNNAGWVQNTAVPCSSLAEVFRCVVEHRPRQATALPSSQRADVDAFIGQATIALNQAVLRQLGQYSLSRLRFDGSGTASFSPDFLRGSRNPAYHEYNAENGETPLPALTEVPDASDPSFLSPFS